jgi:hypothetical protein
MSEPPLWERKEIGLPPLQVRISPLPATGNGVPKEPQLASVMIDAEE